ncbi:MAG: hypothetical protein SNJ58_11030 [Aggregatilineales bacterium]
METLHDPKNQTQESAEKPQDDQTLPVPPPTFRERLRAARRLREAPPTPPPDSQPSAEEAKQSSKRR